MKRKEDNIATRERPKQEASPVIKRETKKKVKAQGKIEILGGTLSWAYMINEHGLTSDQLVQLRQAIIPAEIKGKPGTLVRVFAPTSCEAKGITVQDFNSLNEHSDLILYEGYYYGRGGPGEILIEKRTGTGPSLLEQELRDGGITDVGMREESSVAQKFLTFVLRGGFILIILLIVGIVFAVLMLTK